MSFERKIVLLFAVRELQSCDKEADWNTSVETFNARLDLVVAGCAVKKSDLMSYFTANWFTDEWRGKLLRLTIRQLDLLAPP